MEVIRLSVLYCIPIELAQWYIVSLLLYVFQCVQGCRAYPLNWLSDCIRSLWIRIHFGSNNFNLQYINCSSRHRCRCSDLLWYSVAMRLSSDQWQRFTDARAAADKRIMKDSLAGSSVFMEWNWNLVYSILWINNNACKSACRFMRTLWFLITRNQIDVTCKWMLQCHNQ